MKKILFTLLALGPLMVWSQIAPCGFDHAHEKHQFENSQYKSLVLDADKQIQKIIQSGSIKKLKPQGAGTALYNIPVVVHIMHTGGAVGSLYNPNDAQIIAAIDYLNKVWDGTATGFSGGAGDMQIQFTLAKRDPNCNPTNGIVRVNASSVVGYTENGVSVPGSGGAGASELSIKNLSRWNTSDYYNIWIVSKLNGADGTSGQFTAGYAYFPGAGASLDGTVMLATQMQDGDKTLPHEIGHALSLYHPFQGSSGAAICPANDNCTFDGDRVCDTDPVSQNVTNGVYNFACRTGTNTCTNTDYSPLTENNVMGYTTCYTLFSPGQKARALAAMGLASRASLAISNGGKAPGDAPACPPKINFVSATANVPENGLTAVDCRTYRDYTVSMNIASAPTGAANVFIGLAGTATSGADYVLSTNGNFTTPSTTLVFPGGSSANQSFVVRVFDDAAIESNETIVLSFNVVNGTGGNAQKGEGTPSTTLTITDNDVAPQFETPLNAQIGSYTSNLPFPFSGNRLNTRQQTLYTAAELTAAGLQAGRVISIGYFIASKLSTQPYSGFTIRLRNVTQTTLTSVPVSGTTVVFGPVDYSTVQGTNTFNLTNTFVWDGTSNIVVDICWTNTSTTAGDVTAGTGGIAGRTRINYTTTPGEDGCSLTELPLAYTNAGARDVLFFQIAKPGPATETVLNATATNYLGPNQDVVFKSATGKLLARIKNLSAHDYGCTEVRIDRAGAGAKAFLNSNTGNFITEKSVLVTPTTNNAAGQYEITLYYTPQEVNGWKAATGLNWSTSQIIKTANAVSSYPEGTAPGNAVTESELGSKTNYGLDSSISSTFNTGFSGFAVGIPGTSLPVTWLDVTARNLQGNVVVGWSTASESNTSYFEVEMSSDGNTYATIGKVNARGNSNTRADYSYIHSNAPAGTLYYRIRQVDKDGKFSYSAVVSVSVAAGKTKPFVYPVPASSTLMVNFGQIATNARWEILTADMKLAGRAGVGTNALQQQIDISALASGMYFIRITMKDSVEVLRFVKQ